jgi:hypothetical protein
MLTMPGMLCLRYADTTIEVHERATFHRILAIACTLSLCETRSPQLHCLAMWVKPMRIQVEKPREQSIESSILIKSTT